MKEEDWGDSLEGCGGGEHWDNEEYHALIPHQEGGSVYAKAGLILSSLHTCITYSWQRSFIHIISGSSSKSPFKVSKWGSLFPLYKIRNRVSEWLRDFVQRHQEMTDVCILWVLIRRSLLNTLQQNFVSMLPLQQHQGDKELYVNKEAQPSSVVYWQGGGKNHLFM